MELPRTFPNSYWRLSRRGETKGRSGTRSGAAFATKERSTASYAALPLLAEISERHAPAGYVAALHLAAAIVASNDGPSGTAVVRHQYSDALQRLCDLTDRNFALAGRGVEFIYGLQALMAFEDGGVWRRNLDHLADGELPLDCPSCGEYLHVNLDGSAYAMTNFSDSSIAPTPVRPVEPPGSTIGARLLTLAATHGRTDVAAKLPYLFGEAICPSCHEDFEVPSALT
jgi:hypothetical protein